MKKFLLALFTERLADEMHVASEEKKFAGGHITIAVTFRTRGWDDYTKI